MDRQCRAGVVAADARAHGFDLVQRETARGELVWTWRCADPGPQPSFAHRRDAIGFMAQHLAHAVTP
jgi:hypothetical protein